MREDVDLQDEMSCKELVELVTDYLEEDLPARERARGGGCGTRYGAAEASGWPPASGLVNVIDAEDWKTR